VDTIPPTLDGNIIADDPRHRCGWQCGFAGLSAAGGLREMRSASSASHSFPPADTLVRAGTSAVTIVAADAAGNTSSVHFDVEVKDGTKPAIDPPPADILPPTITTGTDGTVPTSQLHLAGVASDNVGVVSITQNPAPAHCAHLERPRSR
jgi:hypothetical protein